MYNLTGITSKGQDYCAVWTELTSGSAGNNIATTFVKILKNVDRDNVHITDVVCRNDSCIPQNRNSHISYMLTNSQILSITIISGHSCVYEVDNMHKQVEDTMSISGFC